MTIDLQTQTITVVLADDHPLVRRGLRLLIGHDPALRIVAEAADVASAILEVRDHKPDVVLLDVGMPGGPSSARIEEFNDASPTTALVLLSMQDEPALAQAALRNGALGFLLKDQADEELLDAVRAASHGQPYVSPRLGARIATLPARPACATVPGGWMGLPNG